MEKSYQYSNLTDGVNEVELKQFNTHSQTIPDLFHVQQPRKELVISDSN